MSAIAVKGLAENPGLATEAETAMRLFALTYITRWFSFATQSYMLAVEKSLPAALISVSTALVFPMILIGILWNLRLTGLWLNFALTALLAAVLSGVLLFLLRRQLWRPDEEREPPVGPSEAQEEGVWM